MAWHQIAQSPPNHVQLIDITASRPQRSATNQLRKQTANRPHIDRRAVLRVADQQLRRAVPTRGHIVRVVLAGTQHSSESKVTQLHLALCGQQNVLGLYVAMQTALAMAVGHCLQRLIGQLFGQVIRTALQCNRPIKTDWK